MRAAASIQRRKTPAEDFAEATAVHSRADAPKDGSFIVARDRSGDVAHIRWRMHPDLEGDGEHPYWARLDTDEDFDFIAWVPSSWTERDFIDVYE